MKKKTIWIIFTFSTLMFCIIPIIEHDILKGESVHFMGWFSFVILIICVILISLGLMKLIKSKEEDFE